MKNVGFFLHLLDPFFKGVDELPADFSSLTPLKSLYRSPHRVIAFNFSSSLGFQNAHSIWPERVINTRFGCYRF